VGFARPGLAAVSGLQGSAAATLAGKRGIQAVDPDALLSLDMPRLATEASAEAGRRPEQRGSRDRGALPSPVEHACSAGRRSLGARVPRLVQRLGFMLDSGIDPHHSDTQGRVDATRSWTCWDVRRRLKDGTTVPFTEADTVQKYFPGAEVYTDLFFHGTHTGATVSSNAVRAAGVTSMTTLWP